MVNEYIRNLTNYESDSTKFGGLIYPSDFNTDYRGKDNFNGSPIAARIVADRNFDESNIAIIKNREKMKELKRMEGEIK